MADKFIPPYLRDKLSVFRDYGIPKCIPCLLVTTVECAVIAGLLWMLIEFTKNHILAGHLFMAALCLVALLGWSIISRKKAKDKRNDSIEEKS